ncbi:hypothetical protein Syun_031788 [Stephania yunnanensis]|uniref:MADS-box domain-containing protein n=1 Tax=Stephania yunnanensis TaxID=152371 RepID=A0AAP0HB87_9MAGN
MGRRKIEIKAIEDNNKRQVTFSKRRKGLFKKAEQMCLLDETMKMSLVVFSPAGKPFSFHHPSVDTVIDRFFNGQNPSDLISHDTRQSTDMKDGVSTTDAPRFWWEKVNMDKFQTLEDLTNFENELERVKNMAMARMQKIESRRSSHEASTSSSTRVNCGFDDPVTLNGPLSTIAMVMVKDKRLLVGPEIGASCTFMRNAASEKDLIKTRAALRGGLKKKSSDK